MSAILRRLGPLSPLATLSTFSRAASSLLSEAERAGELALHVVRAIWWSLVVVTTFQWFGVTERTVVISAAWLSAVWLLALVGLRSRRAFTFTRYSVVLVDAWLVIGVGVVLLGPFGPVMERIAAEIGAPVPQGWRALVASYVPPMLVYLALTGALRLDPRVALLSGALAVSGAAVYAVELTDQGPGVFVLAIVVLSAILAANAARVVRYLVLKATQGAVYESYVPESLSRDLATHGALEQAGRVEDVTLLLCDVRGFTKLSERMSPAETVTFVNAYLDAVCPPITASGGVIDKFMGDGVLAFFEGGGNASRALDAARRIVDAAAAVSGGELRVGVALHSGQVLVGSIGPRTRREYTIISDAVNTISKLEELNKVYGSQVIASDATIDRVGEAERVGFEGPVDVAVRGREARVRVFVYGAAASADEDRDLGDRLRRFVGRDTA